MATTMAKARAVQVSNVRYLNDERQRRAARRMAMQAIALQLSYPYLFLFFQIRLTGT
jgi:hypothetical protein